MHCKGGDKRSQKDEEKGIGRSSWEISTRLHNVKAREHGEARAKYWKLS